MLTLSHVFDILPDIQGKNFRCDIRCSMQSRLTIVLINAIWVSSCSEYEIEISQ